MSIEEKSDQRERRVEGKGLRFLIRKLDKKKENKVLKFFRENWNANNVLERERGRNKKERERAMEEEATWVPTNK